MIGLMRFDTTSKEDPLHYVRQQLEEAIPSLEINFQPGINILLGPNMVGKSTVISAIGRILLAERNSTSRLSHRWMYDMVEASWPYKLKTKLRIEHDGRQVIWGDGAKTGIANFSDVPGFESKDDILDGKFKSDRCLRMSLIGNAAANLSAGEKCRKIMRPVVEYMQNHKETMPSINWSCSTNHNGVEQAEKEISGMIRADLPPGATILLDEPEVGLDMFGRIELAAAIRTAKRNGHQIILASHCPSLLQFWEEANLIELEPGYCEKIRAALRSGN